MHSSGPPPFSKRTRLFRRFVRDGKGTTAIEFAFIAVPFLALLLSIFEFGLAYFVNRVLDNAMNEATRLVKTGQAYQQNFDKTKFMDAVCSSMAMLPCGADRLTIDVRSFKAFAEVKNLPEMSKPNGDLNPPSYSGGTAGDIIVARALYRWPMFSALLQLDSSDGRGMERMLTAAAVFRNEPFPTK